MATISVHKTDQEGRLMTFLVTVEEDGSETEHEVTLRAEDHERLTGGSVSEEQLITLSFEFLLAREPKESILRSFDLMDIGRYFPEYESAVKDV